MIFTSALVLLWALTSGTTGDVVIQTPSPLLVKEGTPLFINCTYQSSGYPTLFWYIQDPNGGALQRLLSEGSEEKTPDGFSAKKNKEEKSFHLQKDAIDLSNSATYFCALIHEAGQRIIFGPGTSLEVRADLEDSEPSIYQLNPQQKEDEPPISACLFTDYSPDNILIGLNSTLNPVNSSIVLVDDGYSSTASYGTVLWGNNDRNISCHASYNGKIYIKDHMEDDGDACLTGEFETDEKLNFLSLTVLGLRIIFLKTVAVNLILTFRLWSC